MIGHVAAFTTRLCQQAPRSSSLIVRNMARKAGVASPEELKEFVQKAGEKLVVVDVRNPDAVSSVPPMI